MASSRTQEQRARACQGFFLEGGLVVLVLVGGAVVVHWHSWYSRCYKGPTQGQGSGLGRCVWWCLRDMGRLAVGRAGLDCRAVRYRRGRRVVTVSSPLVFGYLGLFGVG